MQAPQYQAPPIDPTVAALSQKASVDEATATQQNAKIDTASVMARYGTRLALSGTSAGSPLAVTPPPVGPSGKF